MERNLAIDVSALSKRLGAFQLQIPQLQLERGVVLGLVGQNGAGKSTLIKILINLIYPDAGEVRLLGLRQPTDQLAIKQRIGYVSENPTFYEEMAVQAMSKVVSTFYPDWDWGSYQRYLSKFGLNPKQRIKQLSKGMKVKFGLLLALAHRPQLLILDEPTSGIDPVMRRELLQEIAAVIQDEQRTVLFSSHITQDVEQIADYVAVLQDGQLAEFDDRESLFGRWRQISCPRGGLQPGWEQLLLRRQESGNTVYGITNQFGPEWSRRAQALGLQPLEARSCSLETILLALAGKEVVSNVGAHL